MAAQEFAAQLSALAVVLDHPGLAADQLLLCSAAQVCSSWRAAVAASAAGTTDVVIDNQLRHPQREDSEFADTMLSKVSSFSTWYPKHAATVRSLTVACSNGDSHAATTAACSMLALSLQLAAAGPRPVRLQRCVTSIASSELLAVLPASLTQLCLDHKAFDGGSSYRSAKSLTAALARCRLLKALSITKWDDGSGDGALQMQVLAELSHLTQLHLDVALNMPGEWNELCAALPGLHQLQDLTLDVGIDRDEGMAPLRLKDMTALTSLRLSLATIPGAGAWLAMPTSLKVLHFTTHTADEDVTKPVIDLHLLALRDLRQLTLNLQGHSIKNLEGTVEVLRQLTAIQTLDLEYETLSDAADDARLWASFPCLSGISYRYHHGGDALPLQHQVIERISPLTRLTRLELTLSVRAEHSSHSEICHLLSNLTRLRKLRLDRLGNGKLPSRACLSLMHLHQLTSLSLRSLDSAVDDTVAVALACNMPQLRDLDFTGAGLTTAASMPVLAQLRHLTRLVLTGSPVMQNEKQCVVDLQMYRRMAGLPELIVLQ